jgi:hypothetical protein
MEGEAMDANVNNIRRFREAYEAASHELDQAGLLIRTNPDQFDQALLKNVGDLSGKLEDLIGKLIKAERDLGSDPFDGTKIGG